MINPNKYRVEITWETDEAILVRVMDQGDAPRCMEDASGKFGIELTREEWLPKSQVTVAVEGDNTIIEIPDWLKKEKAAFDDAIPFEAIAIIKKVHTALHPIVEIAKESPDKIKEMSDTIIPDISEELGMLKELDLLPTSFFRKLTQIRSKGPDETAVKQLILFGEEFKKDVPSGEMEEKEFEIWVQELYPDQENIFQDILERLRCLHIVAEAAKGGLIMQGKGEVMNYTSKINDAGLARIADQLGFGHLVWYADNEGTSYGKPAKRLKVSEDFEPRHRDIGYPYPIFVGEVTVDEYNQCVALHNQIEAQKEGNKVFKPRYLKEE